MTRSLRLGVAFIVVGCCLAPSIWVRVSLQWLLPSELFDVVDPIFVAATFGQSFVIAGIVMLALDLRDLSPAVSI